MPTWTERPTTEGEAPESDPWALLRIPVVDPAGWSSSTVDAGLRSLDRLRGELEAATALLVLARPDDRDATAALSRLSRVSNREARKRRAVAVVVAGLPGALDLLRRGELTVEHLAVLRPVVDSPGVAALLDAAVGMSPEDFGRSVQQYRLALEHGDDVAARQHAARSLRFSNGPDGMVRLAGLFPSLPGATLQTILGAISEVNYRREHPERARVLGGHDADTREQRLADAVLELAGIVPSKASTRSDESTAATAGGSKQSRVEADSKSDDGDDVDGRPSALMVHGASTGVDGRASSSNERAEKAPIRVTTSKPATVIVFNVERFHAEMLNHGPIPVTASLFDHVKRDLYFCFENNAGEVLKYVRGRREPSLLQKIAVWARDLRCQYPGCDATAAMGQIHHLNEWLADLGFTDVEVLILLCHAHHQHVHVNQLIGVREAGGTVSIRVRATGEIITTATPKRVAA